MFKPGLHGVGLGLRRDLVPELRRGIPDAIDFFELAPENWMEMGGRFRHEFAELSGQRPLVVHGLSLNLGGQMPLDEDFLRRIKLFLDEHSVVLFTEHLSWCADDGHLYDLLPLPFTEEAVQHIASRIRRVQEILERRIAVENTSFYVKAPMSSMSEPEFIRAVLDEAQCDLHLDVNNVYVNSVNFGFDPYTFISDMPAERVVYMHMAGHQREADDLVIDTHGADVADAVWDLLDHAYAHVGVHPTLLERDFNIPPLAELMPEIERIHQAQQRWKEAHHAA